MWVNKWAGENTRNFWSCVSIIKQICETQVKWLACVLAPCVRILLKPPLVTLGQATAGSLMDSGLCTVGDLVFLAKSSLPDHLQTSQTLLGWFRGGVKTFIGMMIFFFFLFFRSSFFHPVGFSGDWGWTTGDKSGLFETVFPILISEN